MANNMKLFVLALILLVRMAQSSTLYGIYSSKAVSIDTDDFTMSVLSPGTTIRYYMWRHTSVFDTANNRFYVIGYNYTSLGYALLGVSADSGELDVEWPLPFNAGSILDKVYLAFNNATGTAILTGPCSSAPTLNCVVSVDPSSGSVISLIQLADGASVFHSVYDQKQSIVYFVVGSQTQQQAIVGFSTTTRSVTTKINLSVTLSTFHFDSSSNSLLAITSQGNTQSLVKIDTTKFTLTVLTSLSGYTSSLDSLAALNKQDGTLFTFLSNSTIPPPNTPYYLVALDTTTGDVQNVADACTMAACPLTVVSPV